MKIVKVSVDGFRLQCEMDNGEIYLYDLNSIQDESGEMIEPLKEVSFFKKVYIELGALAWPNGYEIHSETVKRDGKLISISVS